MKFLLKVIGFIGALLILLKLLQVAVDYLYDNYGKKYITTEEE